jgi:hypothetical protein
MSEKRPDIPGAVRKATAIRGGGAALLVILGAVMLVPGALAILLIAGGADTKWTAAFLLLSFVGVLLIVIALPRLGSGSVGTDGHPDGSTTPRGAGAPDETFAADTRVQIALLLLGGLVMIVLWLLRRTQ